MQGTVGHSRKNDTVQGGAQSAKLVYNSSHSASIMVDNIYIY